LIKRVHSQRLAAVAQPQAIGSVGRERRHRVESGHHLISSSCVEPGGIWEIKSCGEDDRTGCSLSYQQNVVRSLVQSELHETMSASRAFPKNEKIETDNAMNQLLNGQDTPADATHGRKVGVSCVSGQRWREPQQCSFELPYQPDKLLTPIGRPDMGVVGWQRAAPHHKHCPATAEPWST
jgi:hypothetical protein